jgi:hypothetical protein
MSKFSAVATRMDTTHPSLKFYLNRDSYLTVRQMLERSLLPTVDVS